MEGTKEKITMEDIFYLFVDKSLENNFRSDPVMLKPFEFNGKVYATDGAAIISTDKANIDFILDNEYEPINCEKVISKSNTSEIITIEHSSEWFEQFKTKYESKEIECEECNECEGLGSIECTCCGRENDCGACHGSGYFREKTDNKIFEDVCIKFKNSFLDIKIFYKLIKVRDFTKKQIELIHYDGAMDAIVFRVGVFDVLLMPLYNPIESLSILTIK